MQSRLKSLRFRDHSGQQYMLEDLGAWANFAFELGYKSYKYDVKDHRCVTIVSVPVRGVFSALIILGAMAADAEQFKGEGLLSWEAFNRLENGQLVYFTDRNKLLRGYLADFNQAYEARAIQDSKSVTHFVTEENLSRYKIRFSSPKSKGKTHTDETKIISAFNTLCNLTLDPDWLRTLQPNISLNAVKYSFMSTIAEIDCVYGDNTIGLSALLCITENTTMAAGKVLLKSEKSASSELRPKLAILATGSFERLIRDYSYSDLIIVLEHHEYDENIATLARAIRQSGNSSVVTDYFSKQPLQSVKVISKIMRRSS